MHGEHKVLYNCLMTENELANIVIDRGLKIHKQLGPGLLESIYEECLVYELSKKGLEVQRQVPLPLKHEGITFSSSYRLDILVEGKLIVELKTVEEINNLHIAQLLTYLKVSDRSLGLLLNFNVVLFKYGIKRVINGFDLDR
jgi:GxxExxY protein